MEYERKEGRGYRKRRVRGKVGFNMIMIFLLQLGRKEKGSEWKREERRGEANEGKMRGKEERRRELRTLS
jgi:hypothetical protein